MHAHKHAAVRAQPALQSKNNDGESEKEGERRRRRKQMILEDLTKNRPVRPSELKRERERVWLDVSDSLVLLITWC